MSISFLVEYGPPAIFAAVCIGLIAWDVLDRKRGQTTTGIPRPNPASVYPNLSNRLPWRGKWFLNRNVDVRIPLMDATRFCYESVEGTFLGDWVRNVNDTPHKRLAYFYASFVHKEIPLFGAQAPSEIPRKIPKDEAKRCVMIEGTNDIRELVTKKLAYKNVHLLKSDLDRHVDYLNSIKSLNEV